jgi:small-conductance mechanosensitive channel
MDNLDKSLPYLIVAGIILATFIVAFLVRWLYWRVIRRSILEKADPKNYRFLGHLISFVIYLTGFGLAIYQIESLRGLANSLLAGAGILAAAVGLASQKAFSNIVSGVFIVMFKPYRINDRVVIRDIRQGDK